MDALWAALCAWKPVSASDTPKESGWRKFLLPGFRSGNLLLSALSFVGYVFLLLLCLNLQVTDATPLRLIVNRIGATIAFFSCVLFTGNYLNVQSKFFLTRSKNLFLRILGIVIADVVLFFCVVAVVSMLESFMRWDRRQRVCSGGFSFLLPENMNLLIHAQKTSACENGRHRSPDAGNADISEHLQTKENADTAPDDQADADSFHENTSFFRKKYSINGKRLLPPIWGNMKIPYEDCPMNRHSDRKL